MRLEKLGLYLKMENTKYTTYEQDGGLEDLIERDLFQVKVLDQY